MQIGISSACLYPSYTEKAVQSLLETGVKTLEVFFNTASELEQSYLREMRAMVDAYGAQIVSVHPYTSGMEGLLFFTDYKRRFTDGAHLYKSYFEAATILGAEKVVFHGGYKEQKVTMQHYIERYVVLDEIARAMGCRLCHENVERSMSRSPALFEALRAALPQADFVLDVKQAVRAGVDPFAMLDAMGDRVAHVHLSDNAPDGNCLPPGQGTMDLAAFFTQLMAGGFNGTMVIELYRNNYQLLEHLNQSRNYAQHLWDSLQK